MEDIIIEKTSKTPAVHFNFEENRLEIAGVSIPEDADNFYYPLLEWVDGYLDQKKNQATTVILKLIYFNTATSDYLVTMLKNLKKLQEGYQEEDLSKEEMPIAPSENGFHDLDRPAEINPELSAVIAQQTPMPEDTKAPNQDENAEEEGRIVLPTHPLRVEWHYEEEDEDMRETGTHFESIIDLPFVFKAVEEID
ncbi:MAG: DUF1987 domain-containing protein [Microscillaceae bacterium]|nr:DUF1987 domain-containing protein [Microscillaceae bacterium]